MEGVKQNLGLQQMESSSPDDLLRTKLTFPRLRSLLVRRERLLARLDEGLEQKLTLISAPAGFGKTSLAVEWVSERMKDEGVKFAWLSLDDGDNDPARFWRYAFSACSAFDGEASQHALGLLQGSRDPAFDAILTAFINDLALLPGKNVLILEDYHTITSRPVHETLTFLLEYLPASLYILLLTRSDPPLPLARLRAQNGLNELRAADLRFSLDETRAFLERALPLAFSPEVVTRLAERTEGWPAGLHLVTLALQGRQEGPEVAQFLATFTGSHRPILEYLVADVFAAQPEDIQGFLLQTSILDRLSGSLCDAVTGRSDSAEVLERLDKANLFLSPLDNTGQWYRYHDLFAEAMQYYARQRLGEVRLRELARQASLWYEEHQMLAEAVEVALTAHDFERAADLVEHIVAPRLVQNEFHTLRRWMGQIPEAVLHQHPDLCLTYAVSILFTSDRHARETKALLEPPLEVAIRHWKREGNKPKLGSALALKSLVSWLQRDVEGSISLARQALELLPEGEAQWRGISLIFIGVEQMMAGRLNAARQTLLEARALCEAAENIYGSLDSALLLAEVLMKQGELHQAAQIYQDVLVRVETAPVNRDQALIRLGRSRLGLGTLALEWNDLEKAERDLSQAVDASKRFPGEDLLAPAPLLMVQLQQARGEVEEARQSLRALIAQTRQPLLARQARAYLARIDLASGSLVSVQRWAEMDALPGDEIPLVQREQEALILARLKSALGEYDSALSLLESWLGEAQDDGRFRSELEILILIALIHAARGSASQASQALGQALTMAQPEGFRRIFLDEGEPLRSLLAECRLEIGKRDDERLLDYVDSLLADFRKSQIAAGDQELSTGQISAAGSLPEPLSEQEVRVLRLLSGGLSNPEIAHELIVSINTVKTHVKSIYRKLDVNSRREAREVARRLKLL